MSPKTLSVATMSRFVAIVAGLILLAAYGGGSTGTTTPTGAPAVTLSATTLPPFSSGVGVASAPQTVTVTNSGNATLNFVSIAVSSAVYTQNNNCGTSLGAGSACTITVIFTPTAAGAANGTLTITDNASNSPQTVALNGTGSGASVSVSTLTYSGVAVGTTSAAQPVTLTNSGSSALAITSITASGAFSETDNCGSSVAASGNCTINVTFAPTASGTSNGTLTIVDAAGTQTVALTGTNTVANVVPVTVSLGPAGNTGSTVTNYYNGIFTTITVCEPSTTTCQNIDNVLVDTGSVGLRVLSSAMSGLSLPQLNDGAGNNLYNCTEFGDLSYVWGPMQLATVQVGGETASQIPTASGGTANSGIPIQVITANGGAPAGIVSQGSLIATPCASGGGPSDNTPIVLGANGILGIGNFTEDCGSFCVTSGAQNPNYVLCPSSGTGNCVLTTVPLAYQAWNPVAAFSSADTNGVELQLPFVPAAGAATAPGTLTFGIGTQTNNAIPGTATTYEIDSNGNFQSLVFNGVAYTTANSGGSYIDSGSNALYVSDPAT